MGPQLPPGVPARRVGRRFPLPPSFHPRPDRHRHTRHGGRHLRRPGRPKQVWLAMHCAAPSSPALRPSSHLLLASAASCVTPRFPPTCACTSSASAGTPWAPTPAAASRGSSPRVLCASGTRSSSTRPSSSRPTTSPSTCTCRACRAWRTTPARRPRRGRASSRSSRPASSAAWWPPSRSAWASTCPTWVASCTSERHAASRSMSSRSGARGGQGPRNTAGSSCQVTGQRVPS